jgi:pilus assembly protein Flp/PilA
VNRLIERVMSSLRIADARQQGQGVTEYALILMLIAVVVILMLGVLGGTVGNHYSNVASSLPH